MQKKLSDYMKTIINRKDLLRWVSVSRTSHIQTFGVSCVLNFSPSSGLCSEFYEPNALMMEEEGAVIAGLLVGLNVIDANLCMKGEDLDSQVTLSQQQQQHSQLSGLSIAQLSATFPFTALTQELQCGSS